jgi:hypothetical protein
VHTPHPEPVPSTLPAKISPVQQKLGAFNRIHIAELLNLMFRPALLNGTPPIIIIIIFISLATVIKLIVMLSLYFCPDFTLVFL